MMAKAFVEFKKMGLLVGDTDESKIFGKAMPSRAKVNSTAFLKGVPGVGMSHGYAEMSFH